MSRNSDARKRFWEIVVPSYAGKYDFSKFVYAKRDIASTVICLKHGEFVTRPKHLLDGSGCPECGNESISKKARERRALTKTIDIEL